MAMAIHEGSQDGFATPTPGPREATVSRAAALRPLKTVPFLDRGAGLPTAQAAFEGSAAGGAMTQVPGISLFTVMG